MLQISCLLWFETNAKIAVIEKLESLHGSVPPMIREAAPTRQFRSWLYTVLTTTQVSRNVVYLALLFVYRLKRTIPCPRGRKGSEYRLLSVALMMGNKCMMNSYHKWHGACTDNALRTSRSR